MPFHKCNYLREMLEAQIKDILDSDQYKEIVQRMVEVSGHYVSREDAILRFLNSDYGQEFAKTERVEYCGSRCPFRADCLDAEDYVALYTQDKPIELDDKTARI